MSVDNSEMIAMQKALEALQNDIPEIMDNLAVQEGEHAVKEARRICKQEKIVNLGDYRRNFKCGTKALRNGNLYTIDFYNNLDYAKPLEYGFRKHYVPGHYLSGHWRDEYPNGLVVGAKQGFVPGKYVLKRAKSNTEKTAAARLERKYLQELKKRGLDKYMK